MAAEVGGVYIDFVVKNTVSQQIDQLSSQAASRAQQSFANVGKTAGESMGARMNAAFSASLENAKKSLARVEDAFEANEEKLRSMWSKKNSDYDGMFSSKNKQAEFVDSALMKDKAYTALLAQNERLCTKLQAARDRVEVAAQAAARRQATVEAKTLERTAAAAERAKTREEKAAQRAADTVRRANEKAAANAHSTWDKAGNGIQRIHTKLTSSIQRRWSKATSGIVRTMHTVMRTARRVFVLGAFLAFFRGIKTAVSNAISQNDELSASLAKIKGNLSIAFSAVFTAALPALTSLMNGLAAVTAKLASFLSVLFGSTFAKSAAAAKGLSAVAGAAKKAKNATAGFDELNVMSNDNDSGSGTAYDFSSKADEAASKFAEQIRTMVQAQDWDGLGILLGDKINDMLARVDASSIGTALGNKLKAGIDTLYRMIVTVKWEDIGKKAAQMLNNALSKIDASKLGAILVSKFTIALGLLGGFLSNLDWAQLGQKLTDGLLGALSAMTQSLNSFDWAGLGTNILTFLSNIDWVGILGSLFDLIGAAWPVLIPVLVLKLTGTLSRLLVDSLGKFVSTTLISNIGDWVGLIADKLSTGVTTAFSFITKTLLPGLCNAFTTAFSFIAANPIVLLIAAIVALVALIAVKGDEIQAAFAKVNNFMQNIFARDWSKSFGAFGNVLNAFFHVFKGIWDGVALIFNGVIDFIRGVFTGNWARAWNGVIDVFKGIFGGLEAIVKAPINGVLGLLNMAIDAVNSLITGFNSIGFDTPKWLGGGSWHPNIGAIPKIPLLANGGVIDQPTLAMMGEYSGAHSNPEIVAPESKISEIMTASMTPVLELLRQILQIMAAGGADQQDIVADITLLLDGLTIYHNQEKIKAGKGYSVSQNPNFV